MNDINPETLMPIPHLKDQMICMLMAMERKYADRFIECLPKEVMSYLFNPPALLAVIRAKSVFNEFAHLEILVRQYFSIHQMHSALLAEPLTYEDRLNLCGVLNHTLCLKPPLLHSIAMGPIDPKKMFEPLFSLYPNTVSLVKIFLKFLHQSIRSPQAVSIVDSYIHSIIPRAYNLTISYFFVPHSQLLITLFRLIMLVRDRLSLAERDALFLLLIRPEVISSQAFTEFVLREKFDFLSGIKYSRFDILDYFMRSFQDAFEAYFGCGHFLINNITFIQACSHQLSLIQYTIDLIASPLSLTYLKQFWLDSDLKNPLLLKLYPSFLNPGECLLKHANQFSRDMGYLGDTTGRPHYSANVAIVSHLVKNTSIFVSPEHFFSIMEYAIDKSSRIKKAFITEDRRTWNELLEIPLESNRFFYMALKHFFEAYDSERPMYDPVCLALSNLLLQSFYSFTLSYSGGVYSMCSLTQSTSGSSFVRARKLLTNFFKALISATLISQAVMRKNAGNPLNSLEAKRASAFIRWSSEKSRWALDESKRLSDTSPQTVTATPSKRLLTSRPNQAGAKRSRVTSTTAVDDGLTGSRSNR